MKYVPFLILALVLFSCQSKHKDDVENALQDVVTRFPQLPSNEGKLTDFYKLTRTVIIGEKNIELQLRTYNEYIADYQQIIVIRNPQNAYYAIPFFSNLYRDYWNFEFDNLETGFNANTTFEREFNKAMEILNLHDTLGRRGNVQSTVREMFRSLLLCRQVYLSDSTEIIENICSSSYIDYNYSLNEENEDSCEARHRRNFEDIKSAIQISEYYFILNTIWDEENNRIYQITNLRDMWEREKCVLKLKTYRQGCIYHLISM